MGYTTYFTGQFDLDKPLTIAHSVYLRQFSETRRMKRDPVIALSMPDLARDAVGLPIGVDGGYFVGNQENSGQIHGKSVVEYNSPPKGQPGLWCQWIPNSDDRAIVHDGGEKFSYYTEWLEYLIDHFIKPWGYKLNGMVEWSGEDSGDLGRIYVKDNVVTVKEATISFD